MDNNFLKRGVDFLTLQKMRQAGIDLPLEAQLSEAERLGDAPIRPPEQQIYSPDTQNASPEQLQQFEAYKLHNTKPSVGDQLKAILPPPAEQPSVMRDLMSSWHPPQVLPGQQAPAPSAPVDQLAPKQASSAPSNPLSVLDFGQNTLASQQGLQEAQGRQNDLQFLANMNRAGAQIAQGLSQSPNKLDTSVADAVERQGKGQVENYQQQVEFQKQDPNSSYSKGLKDYFKNNLKMEIRGDASAAELEKIMPLAVREYEAKLERERLKQQRAEDLAYKKDKDAQDRDLKRELLAGKSEKDAEKASTKATDKANADFMKMAEKLSGAKASSRSAFGKAALNKAAAERLETLVEGRDLNSLDNRELQEVARSLDALLAQGQPTISGTHELVPSTARGDVAKLFEYISNQRQGANAGSFLKQMVKTVGREKELALKQMNEYKKELVPGYEHLEKVDPERYNRILLGGASSGSSSPQGGLVKIKQKSTGLTKTLSTDAAKKYLSDKDFEEVK